MEQRRLTDSVDAAKVIGFLVIELPERVADREPSVFSDELGDVELGVTLGVARLLLVD